MHLPARQNAKSGSDAQCDLGTSKRAPPRDVERGVVRADTALAIADDDGKAVVPGFGGQLGGGIATGMTVGAFLSNSPFPRYRIAFRIRRHRCDGDGLARRDGGFRERDFKGDDSRRTAGIG